MFLEYYRGAFARSWSSAWDWAVGQGIILSLALGASALVCTVLISILRAHGKHHSWGDAREIALNSFRDFALSAIGATVFLFTTLFAIFFVMDAPDQASLTKKTIEGLQTKIEIQNAKGILVECHIAVPPATFPASGRMDEVFIFGDGSPNQMISTAYTFGPPNGQAAWPPGTTALNFLQCAITNYSDEVLIDIDLRPKLDFSRMSKRPDGNLQGQGIDRSKESHVQIAKIDPGSDKHFTFYFVNQTPIFIDVEMPASAEAQHLDGKRIAIPVASTPKRSSLSVYTGPSP
jgi:hypothetical protein